MRPHARVHGRGQHQGAVKGQGLGGQHVVCRAVGQPGKGVRRGRGHHQGMGVLARLQMGEDVFTGVNMSV